MNSSIRLRSQLTSETALDASAALWTLTAVIGQWLFALYILVNYGASSAVGDFAKWNRTLIHGLTRGDVVGDIAIAAHVLTALVITAGGPLQLLLASTFMPNGLLRLGPQLRAKTRAWHRWNGRVYVTVAIIVSTAGLYMTWTQKPVLFKAGPAASAASLAFGTLTGVLILLFAALALYYAVNRNIDTHRRWALRLFMVASAVWFQRIGYGFWTVVTGATPFGGGAPGTAADMDGSFDMFLGFARTLLPLLFLELYFQARKTEDPRAKWAMAATLLPLTVIVGIGTVGAAKLMWLPPMLTPP